MEKDYQFLPYFISEPIYYIPSRTKPEELLQDDVPAYPIPQKVVSLNPWGNFRRKVLILVDDHKAEILSDHEFDFLKKILKAVSLSEDDIALINIRKVEKENYAELRQQFDFRIGILFGVTPFADLQTEVSYKIKTEDNKKLLYVDALSVIDKDKQKKLKLWENLQLLFVK